MKRKLFSLAMVAALVLTLVPAVAFAAVVLPDGITEINFGSNTVFDGTNYYLTMKDALEGIHCTGKDTLWCKPGADVGNMTHGHVCRSLTVYGNGAYVSDGECDFEVDTYTFCHQTSNTCSGITGDLTLTINNLNKCAVWGQRNSTHTVNIILNNCEDVNRVYISGTSGDNNITITGCTFTNAEGTTDDCKVYSNANGSIKVEDSTFTGVIVPINLNHKVAGTQTIEITESSFTNCGTSSYEYAAPVRVLSSVNGATSKLTVTDCSFSGTVANSVGQQADILLDSGAGDTIASVSGTSGKILNEETAAETTELEADKGYTVAADGTITETSDAPAPKPSSGSGISITYNGGNSFSTSNPSVPTGVEIDNVPVSFTGNGNNFTVSGIPAGAKWITVRWNSTSVTTNFTPNGAYFAEVEIPKTGDMPLWAAIAAVFGF